ncbi:MAG TPA: hypothetical protein VG269_27690 [Tepidisphaeraceae bacterium]|jgi:hypothetical protein|nr:hypothetical protein [Tepidisphaeraceae bacterium]
MPTLESGATLGEVAGILHAAVMLGPAAWGREPMPEAHMATDIEDRLKSQLIELFRILHERSVPYVLVGGIAMLTYIEGRNTKDVDLVVSVESLKAIPEIVIYDQNRDFARGKFGALLVDFLFTNNPLFKLVQDQYSSTQRFLETDIQCATVEGLILLKLFALPSLYREGRGQRIGLYENDVYMLCELARPSMEPLLVNLQRFVDPSALQELRNIVGDIQRRIERVDRARASGGGTDRPSPPK